MKLPIVERKFGAYRGPLTPLRTRPWVLARLSWRQVRGSRLLALLLSAAAISWLVFAILIYLHYNAGAIAVLRLAVRKLVPINARFFERFLGIEAVLSFFMMLLLIPPVFSRDLAHQGLSYYFSRPLTKPGYIWGKLALAAGLLSAVTWLPGLLLWGLQAGLAGFGWAKSETRLLAAIFFASLIWIVVMALPAAAISAWMRRRLSATAVLLAWFFVPGFFAGILNRGLTTPWADLISPMSLTRIAWRGLFQLPARRMRPVLSHGRMHMTLLVPVPAWCAYLTIGLLCLLCVAILWRRLEPLRIVRG